MTISKDPSTRGLQINPHDAIGLIVRRKRIIGFALAASIIGGVGTVATQREHYSATAAIALDARKIQAAPQDVVVSRLSQESPFLRTEIDVITSRAMAEAVMNQIGDDRIRLSIKDPVRSTSLLDWVSSILRSGRVQQQIPVEITEDARRKAIIDYLLSGLRVDNDGRSYTVFISFAAEDPVLAAQVANAYANAYLDHLASIQTSATRDVSQWLAKRLGELRGSLENSERAVQSFRQSAELVEANGMTLQGNRLNALNLQLIQARSERAAAEARIEVARRYMNSEKGVEAFGDVLKSPVIQNLRQQDAQIERAIQDLRSSGAMQSAQLSSLTVQKATLQQQMDEEVSRIIESLASEVEVMVRREKDIEGAIAETWQRTAQESKDLVKLQQLEREANANRTIYESFLNRYKQTIEQEGFVAPEARLISSAEVPSRAAGRNVLATLIFSLMGGGIAGLGLAFGVDRFDRRIRSGLRLEEMVGLPVIGRLPVLTKGAGLRPQDQIVTMPRSAYSEAMGRLAAALQCSRFVKRAKVIVVTSSGLGEGKSTTCASLARALAGAGKKVIVVDADLHRPSVAATFGHVPVPNLGDLLSGAKSIQEIVRQDESSDAHFIAGCQIKDRPQQALQGGSFRTLIQGLRERYDFVIVDSPPISATVDAALVGAYADAVLLVVRWGSTSDTAVLSALDELNIFAAPVSGIILNRVASRSKAYEGTYTLIDHPTSFPVRRQQNRAPEEARILSKNHLRTTSSQKLSMVVNDRPSTPPA